ncbi:MAG: phage portal protein [Pseudomonadota bacterium]
MARKKSISVTTPPPVEKTAIGGAYEGAERANRELASWAPPIVSPDREISRSKQQLDGRTRDLVRNDGYMLGALNINRDSIVGGQYMLNAKPDWKILGMTEAWAEEFQLVAESRFRLVAESTNCWLDASGRATFTGLVRLALAQQFLAGEPLATVEWLRSTRRPYKTAIQMIDPDRLTNPQDRDDTQFMRRGIETDFYGAPVAYHIRLTHPNDSYPDGRMYEWRRVAARKPWGRAQVIHVIEAIRPDQHRGVAEMVSVLKDMRMTKRYNEIVLQNAVVNATYAATIESELPRDIAFAQLGEGSLDTYMASYLAGLTDYVGATNAIAIDGAKIPHLYPGTKLNLRPAGQPGGVGTEYEQSLLRHVAAGLGLSYEEFARDYTQTNYSSARAANNNTHKYMQAKKKIIADRFASMVYELWLEEAINAGELPMPKGLDHFYEGLNKEAYSRCSWIGASKGQIDELKETQAAVLRINAGLSTWEDEIARFGNDWREVFAQRKREQTIIRDLGLELATDPQKSGTMQQNGGQANDVNERGNGRGNAGNDE